MKGDAQPLIKFFDGSDKRLIIPLYQRNYDWKEENCERLFQDLMKLHNSDRRITGRFFDPLKMADVIIMNGIKNVIRIK